MEEVDLRQFWGPEYRWEDSVPGMTEHEVVIEEEVAMTAERRGKEGRTQQQQIQSQHHSVAPHENVPHPPVPPSFPTPAQQCPSACRRPSATQKQHSGRRQWTQRWTR